MPPTDLVPIFRFDTTAFPASDRFHLWVKDNLCDNRFEDDGLGGFDAEASGAALGPLILSGRRWHARPKPPTYFVHRTARRIRIDGQDSIRFTLLLGGGFVSRSASGPETELRPGELIVYDVAQVNECRVQAGDVISLVVPRHLLPSHAALLHEQKLGGGIGRVLGDHLVSLYRNLATLRQRDVPSVVQSTLLLLSAAVSPTLDALREAASPIRVALMERIQHYIDVHLLDRDLTPERICRDVGISRARLYQLFEEEGGVMRQIRRRRLRHAYHVLGDPQRQHVRIAEIAWTHGFPDEKYFYRAFRSEFGHTPKETLERSAQPVLLPTGNAGAGRWQGGAGLIGWTLPFGVLNN